MNVSLKEKKVSTTRKRVDAKAEVSSFWTGESWAFKFRLLAYEPIDENLLSRIAEEIAERRKDWKELKHSFTLPLPEYNANAFIWLQENKEE